jgi:hypothetical protein
MRKFIVLCLVAVLISGSVAFAAVEKVKVRKIDILKVQNIPEVRVELEVQGSGTIFVQASTDYDKYTYVTEPVTLEISSPQPFFVLRFTKGGFRRVKPP